MLSLVPTPIGNREDITLRALRYLKELPVFFCEDTRMTIKLMRLYDIDRRNKQLHSFTSFTSEQKSIQYIDIIKEQHCGMLSDAGTPGLSDPGKALVKFCREYQLPFEVLPGATALIPAVVAGGFDTSSFVYL
ncbi:MAG: hypothetical protein H6765_05290 [Candidatus Peribacteria bacterium]|nr:MAG: hypothetical protein H6765_05290 [Candidatus Peribacteria bacterium]